MFEEQKEVTKSVGGVCHQDHKVDMSVVSPRPNEMKTWKYFELSQYDWMTASEDSANLGSLGSGLVSLRLNPKDTIPIYASTCETVIAAVVYMAYLPLSHIIEFTVERVALMAGGSLGFGNPRTLTDSSTRNSNGDLRELCPHIIVGVPAVWKSVMGKLREGSPPLQRVFENALKLKWLALQMGFPDQGTDWWAALVGIVGWCAGADGDPKVLTTAVCPILNGFGLTEASAINLIKLSYGEYIAIEKLESIYGMSRFVQKICVVADPERSYPIAVVIPIEKEAANLYKSLHPENDDKSHHIELKDFAKDEGVKAKILADLKTVGGQNKLKGAEIVQGILLAEEEWPVVAAKGDQPALQEENFSSVWFLLIGWKSTRAKCDRFSEKFVGD
ncbi:hypothetical protein BJ742DRAFT_780508 [Cladochytrium replicatum]|nr:hypothetical protein BJ742DRAFT_780508 [Cladochytrium replicatum]